MFDHFRASVLNYSLYTPTSGLKPSVLNTFKSMFRKLNKAGLKSGEITDGYTVLSREIPIESVWY